MGRAHKIEVKNITCVIMKKKNHTFNKGRYINFCLTKMLVYTFVTFVEMFTEMCDQHTLNMGQKVLNKIPTF